MEWQTWWFVSDVNPSQRTDLDGLPEGVPEIRIASICSHVLEEELASVSFQRIRSHRDEKLDSPVVADFREALAKRGIFRISVTSKSGRPFSLICKNDPRPQGMSDFQQWWWWGNHHTGTQDPTEARIYQGPGSLATIIPGVYGCDTLEPGRHYQYYLEDLVDWQQVRWPTSVLAVTAMLPRLHDALRDWSDDWSPNRLTRCDTLYARYADDIERYARESKDPLVATVRDLWHLLLELAETRPYQSLKELTPIHGDLWVDNVMVDSRDPTRARVIDWESVVSGRPHSDLALLLMRETPITEERALEVYATHAKSMSLSDHWRLYRWCKLEYCLLEAIDAARALAAGETEQLELSYFPGQAIRQARFYSDMFDHGNLGR